MNVVNSSFANKKIAGLIGFIVLGAAVLSTQAAPEAWAEYPEKPVVLIVAYSPGGGTDRLGRVLSTYIQPYLGKRLIVQNMPGDNGRIGFSALAQAPPDGYTIGFISAPSLFIAKKLQSNVAFSMRDFDLIANIQTDPVLLAVRGDSPYRTIGDFIKAAKNNPGKLKVGGDGPRSNNRLQMLVAEKQLGLSINWLSSDGSSPTLTALMKGDLDAAAPSASSSISYLRTGLLRALAVFSNQPCPHLLDVPTIQAATGAAVPVIGASLRGIAAPKGLDGARKAHLAQAFAQVVKDKRFVRATDDMGISLKYMDFAEFSRSLEDSEKETSKFIHLFK
ncbi:MAG: tripartite tricarboxylate transporter substrate binding protein [Deltaproteobacteria bacterium]|nr:tripartite tricarboxylate transporter substrate binding protein [Deltaproteobacteria bacterium]